MSQLVPHFSHPETQYWHGTGIFSYDSIGKIVDVGTRIIESGLQSHQIWTKRDNSHVAVSVAKEYFYARVYAMAFNNRILDESRLADSNNLLWRKYTLEMFKSTTLADKIHYFNTYILGYLQNTPEWTQIKKEYREWTSRLVYGGSEKVFGYHKLRSDIEGNYPLVIGIKPGEYQLHDMSKTPELTLHESRILEHIPPEKFSCIVLPGTKISAFHNPHGIPLIPMEDVIK